MWPVDETLAELTRLRVVVPEEDLVLRQKRQILAEYLTANEPGAGEGPTSKRGRNAQKVRGIPRLPPDLQQIYDLQSSPESAGYFVLDREALSAYARVQLGLRAVRAQADEQVFVVAAIACAASQVHVAEMPPSFTSAELAEELGRL